MVESIFINSGRGCINCSGHLGPRTPRRSPRRWPSGWPRCEALPPTDPEGGLAAFTVPGVAEAIWKSIDADLKAPACDGRDGAASHGPRLVEQGRADYLRPTVVHCESPEPAIAKKEYMFPFVTVVECPQAKMLESIGPTLVCTAITEQARRCSGSCWTRRTSTG